MTLKYYLEGFHLTLASCPNFLCLHAFVLLLANSFSLCHCRRMECASLGSCSAIGTKLLLYLSIGLVVRHPPQVTELDRISLVMCNHS